MKKVFLSVLFMMLSVASFSQVFVRKYTSVISEKENVLGEWQSASLTVVFNEKDTGDIVFYYADSTAKRFHQIGDAIDDKTVSGQKYQIITCIDGDNGNKVAIQLFDEDTLRVLISKGYFFEFHK